jgi:hypothetical protein
VYDRSQLHHEKIKKAFDKCSKPEDFGLGDIVLRWDARNEGKGKHANFNHHWTGLFRIYDHSGKNAYFLKGIDGESFDWGPVNGMFLKHYLME